MMHPMIHPAQSRGTRIERWTQMEEKEDWTVGLNIWNWKERQLHHKMDQDLSNTYVFY